MVMETVSHQCVGACGDAQHSHARTCLDCGFPGGPGCAHNDVQRQGGATVLETDQQEERRGLGGQPGEGRAPAGAPDLPGAPARRAGAPGDGEEQLPAATRGAQGLGLGTDSEALLMGMGERLRKLREDERKPLMKMGSFERLCSSCGGPEGEVDEAPVDVLCSSLLSCKLPGTGPAIAHSKLTPPKASSFPKASCFPESSITAEEEDAETSDAAPPDSPSRSEGARDSCKESEMLLTFLLGGTASSVGSDGKLESPVVVDGCARSWSPNSLCSQSDLPLHPASEPGSLSRGTRFWSMGFLRASSADSSCVGSPGCYQPRPQRRRQAGQLSDLSR